MRDKKGRFIKGHAVPDRWKENLIVCNLGKQHHLGYKHSYKARPNAKGRTVWNKGKPVLKTRGKNHWKWKGGITEINHKIKLSLEYKLWRKSVFERDNYTCQVCKYKSHTSINNKSDIQVHHIKPFAYFPNLRLEITNGITLCISCHRKTETFGKRNKEIAYYEWKAGSMI
jgi:hypothetical protein